jgi:mRNA-degrading endonuclease RelE of RelBE toxin-antitoxin system
MVQPEMSSEALALLQQEPDIGYPLHGRLRDLSSLRIGSYRISYQLADNGKTVRVATIRHRSVVYGSDPHWPSSDLQHASATRIRFLHRNGSTGRR